MNRHSRSTTIGRSRKTDMQQFADRLTAFNGHGFDEVFEERGRIAGLVSSYLRRRFPSVHRGTVKRLGPLDHGGFHRMGRMTKQ